jgi:hypothetical protein
MMNNPIVDVLGVNALLDVEYDELQNGVKLDESPNEL